MTTDYEMTINDYIDILRRRFVMVISIFISFSIITLMLAIFLPPVYQATGTILIESQQISSSFIAPTVTQAVRERIEIVKQHVMTRENILRLINKHNLYGTGDGNNRRVTSDVIEKFRDNVEIEILNTGGSRRGRTTYAFKVSFEHLHANQTYKVTSDVVTLFLDENIKSRVSRATETTEFLSKEAKRLKLDLETKENLVAAYKRENANALPEHLKLHVNMLQRTETILANVERNYKSAENEKRQLELQLTSAEAGVDVGDTYTAKLERLNAEYQQSKILYKENHPTVRQLKRKIESLVKGGEHETPNANINKVYVGKIKKLMNEVSFRLKSLGEQKIPLRKKISKLEKQIIKTPQVELGLISLSRDHSSAQKKYEEIQLKQLGAQVSENLEGENKAGRFILIEPPQLPDKPIKPKRAKIVLIGLFIALAAGLGLALMVEMMNMRIRGKGALEAILGTEPLIEIPYIKTNIEHVERKALIVKIIAGVFGLAILISILIHFLYLPLDFIFYKILSRLG